MADGFDALASSLTNGGGTGGRIAVADRSRTPLVPGTRYKSPDGEPMSDDDFQHIMYTWATDARNYVDEFIALDRAQNTDYYKGRLPDVDEEGAQEDRSKVVMTEVRDTVLGIMPDLLRIFFSTEGVCKYDPVPHMDPQMFMLRQMQARQATDYVQNVVLRQDNPDSFRTFYDAFQDAFVRKTGIIKWYWERSKKPQYSTHTGLTEQEAHALVADDNVSVLGKSISDDPMFGPLYDLKIRRTVERGRLRIRAVPIEHLVIARRNYGHLEYVSLFGFTEDKRAGEFLAEGLIEDLTELATCDNDITDADNIETQARQVKPATFVSPADNVPEDPSQRLVKYGEFYVRVDRDGDGIPELWFVRTAGIRYLVLDAEPCDEVDYAAFCCYPEAHTFFGECIADLTKDIQRIKSRIMRDTLDSLAQAVVPQLTIVEGQVNLDDVLNEDANRVLRQRQPGMISPIVTPFVGKESLPVLELMDKMRENRTGQSDAAAGLNPDALQSSTQDAVASTLNKAQSRIEFVARMFAEMGMVPMFRGILHTLIKHQDQERMAVVSGKPCMIDPRHWDADMAVSVTLMLGRGSTQQQIGALTAILGKQEQLLMEMGPDGPICDIDQYSYTLGKLVELAGWRNTQSFFHDTSQLSPELKQQAIQKIEQMQAQKAQAGKAGPNPQVEMAKIQAQQQTDGNKLKLEMLKAHADVQLQLLKIRGDLAVAAMNAISDHTNDQTRMVLENMVNHFNNQMSAFVDHQGNMMDSMTDHTSNMVGHAITHAGNQMADDTARYAVDNKPAPAGGGS